MPKHVCSPEIIAKAVSLREQGLSYMEIAKALGASTGSTRLWTRGVVQQCRKLKARLTLAERHPELVAEAIRLREQGESVERIACMLGVSASYARLWTRDVIKPSRKRQPKADADVEGVAAQANFRSDSHNFPGHEARFAGHMKRVRDYMREHSN